ncbi:Uncharacterised protein [Mycobacteroides abscessus subsp. abscessus]|nr:Uncharacterised protein [Mycobacteroides abscessus subsp. abscessus]SKU03978.1 Uncharacterised protein [Mycobacteroides abscessus subsp. abscessus]
MPTLRHPRDCPACFGSRRPNLLAIASRAGPSVKAAATVTNIAMAQAGPIVLK